MFKFGSRGGKNDTSRELHADSVAEGIPAVEWDGKGCAPLTVEEYLEPQLHPDPRYQKIVKHTRSFSDLLAPRVDLGNGNIGLQDLTSVGRLFEVVCGNIEARSEATIARLQERVHQTMTTCFPGTIFQSLDNPVVFAGR